MSRNIRSENLQGRGDHPDGTIWMAARTTSGNLIHEPDQTFATAGRERSRSEVVTEFGYRGETKHTGTTLSSGLTRKVVDQSRRLLDPARTRW